MSVKLALAQLRLGKAAVEARAGCVGDNKFWLFVLNILASLALLIVFSYLKNFVFGFFVALFVCIFWFGFDVDSAWRYITKWRR